MLKRQTALTARYRAALSSGSHWDHRLYDISAGTDCQPSLSDCHGGDWGAHYGPSHKVSHNNALRIDFRANAPSIGGCACASAGVMKMLTSENGHMGSSEGST